MGVHPNQINLRPLIYSCNYVDVGLTLTIEPTIYLNNEIGVRISLDVSTLVDTVTTKSGTTTYRIGNRSATTMLQLKDGENQVLAGLIRNDERSNSTKLAGIGNIPLVGRLFGSAQGSHDATEVLLSITPHLVRNTPRQPAAVSEFNAGTENGFRRRPETTSRSSAAPPSQRTGNNLPYTEPPTPQVPSRPDAIVPQAPSQATPPAPMQILPGLPNRSRLPGTFKIPENGLPIVIPEPVARPKAQPPVQSPPQPQSPEAFPLQYKGQ